MWVLTGNVNTENEVQTFLPYPDFRQSAEALDTKRLFNQVNECLVIIRTLRGDYPLTKTGRPGGWPYHPATRQWEQHLPALCRYAMACSDAWAERTEQCDDRWVDLAEYWNDAIDQGFDDSMPPWLGLHEYHLSHQSNLVRKDPEYYTFPVNPDMDYVWPSKL